MPARALCAAERERVLDALSSPRFVDRSPGEVVATLLDEEKYLCSERTMYRVLAHLYRAPCKGAVSQRVEIPRGNGRSRRKQSERMMEVTKSSEALRCKRVTMGDSASMRAAT